MKYSSLKGFQKELIVESRLSSCEGRPKMVAYTSRWKISANKPKIGGIK